MKVSSKTNAQLESDLNALNAKLATSSITVDVSVMTYSVVDGSTYTWSVTAS